jgi:NAD(P)-dependent dehydrogenase (short-subunit alcohol dehydrogenase family)
MRNEGFDGDWAVVTGGSRGIGRAVAIELASHGANVLVLYRVNGEAGRETVEAVHGIGREARAVACDVSDRHAVETVVGDAARELRVAVLVNCAGITADRTVLKLEYEDWTRVIETNLTGVFNCVRAVLPGMRERGFGRIVNVSSIIGQTGNVGQTNYAASKAGLIGLTKSLALETSRHDITANAICPGFIDTDMLEPVPQPTKDALLKQIPKARFGAPAEVARAAAFLASPASGYITGAVLNVNGGLYL